MKTSILSLSAALLVAGGIMVRAQASPEATASTSEESKASMVAQCEHMCTIQYSPESPASLLAWKEKLGLTDDQVAGLKAVEEKAVAEAKALLKPEQVTKLAELSKDMKPQSMMQFMQHCETMMKGKGMMHGKGTMHGMKGGACKIMPILCPATPGEGEAHH